MATANLSVESKDFTLPVVEATAGADGASWCPRCATTAGSHSTLVS